MKISKLFSVAIITGSMFIGQGLFAQDKEMAKKEDKVEKKDKMKVDETMKGKKIIMVGGAEMEPTSNIFVNASNSLDHTTFVSALKSADLVDVLSGYDKYTVFAPTNEAFDRLPEGKLNTLMEEGNKDQLQNLLKYHVVAGKWKAADIENLIQEGNGKAVITTINGQQLTATITGDDIYLSDENGNSSKVTIADVKQSNGIIHVIDNVLEPAARY